MRVASIPVAYRDRPEGSVSKLNTTRDGIKVIKTIFKLCEGYKPLLFFGIISLVLAVVAIPMLISVVNEYFQTGLVPRFPTLIFSLLCLLAALQSAGFGIILDAISQKSKREFEIQLNMILSGERKRAAQKAININSDAGDSNKIAG